MANELDETKDPIREEGRDVNVIDKQVSPKVGAGTYVFIVFLFLLGIIPGVIYLFMCVKAKSYFGQLQQKIQHNASQIDNYLEQRVVILQNAAKLLDKAVDLDKDVLKTVSAYRGGVNPNADATRNDVANKLDGVTNAINLAFEAYPNIQAHKEIADCMQQNSYLQKEITAAREVYNDTVLQWNSEIYSWPVKIMVASKAGYTTRIPFTTSKEMKEKARGTFF